MQTNVSRGLISNLLGILRMSNSTFDIFENLLDSEFENLERNNPPQSEPFSVPQSRITAWHTFYRLETKLFRQKLETQLRISNLELNRVSLLLVLFLSS